MRPTIFGRSTKSIIAVLNAAVSLAVAFGLQWTTEQVAAVNVFSALLILLVANEEPEAD